MSTPDYPALIHGPCARAGPRPRVRCRRLASALRRRGIGEGTPSPSSPPMPAMFEAHFRVPA